MPAADGGDIILEGTLSKRGGSTGQRGGRTNWRSRHCVLAGHVLYYSDSVKSTQANGHLHLQGVGVRFADDDRLLAICVRRTGTKIPVPRPSVPVPRVACGRLTALSVKHAQVFWPEDSEATFYVQAPNAAARSMWIDALRAASACTLSSLAALGMAELKQRVVACGLVAANDFSSDRQALERLLLDHVRRRGPDYHNTPAAVIAHTTEHTTGLARTVLAAPTAKSSLLSAALGMVNGFACAALPTLTYTASRCPHAHARPHARPGARRSQPQQDALPAGWLRPRPDVHHAAPHRDGIPVSGP